MSLRLTFLLCVLSAVAAAAAVKRYLPTEVIKTEIKEVEKIVTVVHREKKPDGTIVEDETRTEDRKTNTDTVASKPAAPPPNWFVSVQYLPDSTPGYGVSVNRRILGPVFIGAGVNTRKELQVSLSVEF